MQDTDIEGLRPEDATEYVLAFVATLKRTEMELVRAADDAATWTRRVTLADQKGDAELAGLARARLAEIEAKKTALEAEIADLRRKVGTLKEKLQRLRAQFQKSVDTDVLLAELQMLAGQKDALADTFKDAEAGAKVEDLKRNLGGGEAPKASGGEPRGASGGPGAPREA